MTWSTGAGNGLRRGGRQEKVNHAIFFYFSYFRFVFSSFFGYAFFTAGFTSEYRTSGAIPGTGKIPVQASAARLAA